VIRAAALSLLLAAPAHAGTVAGWGNDLDPCLDIAAPADPAGRAQWAEWWLGLGCLIPANAGEWAPKSVTRPKPRPPCADVWRPGCPGRYAPGPWRWAGIETPAAAALPRPSTPRWQAEAPRASAVPAIPLPASGLLLLAALAALWRVRR
jgi:hypothetical protein